MCVAGVFGGLNSGVKESAQDVFLESACFDSVSIRKTSKELGLKTDASYRYERGIDPDLVLPAILKAISMLEEIASPVSVEWVDDVYPSVPKPAIVSFSFQRLNEFVGQVIPVAQAKEILLNLGIKILRESGSEAELEIPLFKVDVTREADVFEEILRVYGYNNIGEQSFLRVPVQSQSGVSGLPEKLRDYFSSAGFFEVVNLSMTSEKNLLPGMENLAVHLSNPLSSELSCLRQSLLFGLLENAAFNRNRQAKSIRLFELGRQYFLHPEKKFLEEPRLGVLSGGPANDESWTSPTKEADYFYLKGIFSALTDKLGLKNLRQNTVPSPLGLVTEFSLKSSGQTDWVWRIGPLPSDILKSFSLDGDFTYAEINLPFLIHCGLPWTPAFTELPRFPKVRRDLALLVNQEVSYQQLVDSAYKSESKLLTEVNLFDVYEGKNIPAGKKSYALSFVLYKSDGTLNDSQIEKAMERILKGFREELSAELRS
jgi:phenylalanyl-tRNA synthetase beta chain